MRAVWRSWPGRIGTVLVGLLVVSALVVVRVDAVRPARRSCPGDKWLPISWDHRFGTDGGGKDLFSQVLVGARTTLFVSLMTVVLAAVIGLTLGVLSAITPRYVGESVAHLIDVLIALPTLILALVFVAALGGSLWTVSLALGVGFGVVLARVVRAEVSRVLTQDYIVTAAAVGLVDVAHGVAPHHAEHRADGDRPALADRRPRGARRGGPELPRADAGVDAVVGSDARVAAAVDDGPPGHAGVPGPGRGRWRRSGSTCSATACATPSTRACAGGRRRRRPCSRASSIRTRQRCPSPVGRGE